MGFAEQRPQQHTGAKAVEHAEIDDNTLSGKTEMIHTVGYGADAQAAAKHDQSPLDAVRPQSHTNAGDQQEDDTAPVLDKLEGRRRCPFHKPVQHSKIIDKMDDDHTQNAKSPEGIQLPNAFFHYLPT